MPEIARETLLQQLETSGHLQQLVADARLLLGKRLRFVQGSRPDKTGSIVEPLRVGAIELGWLQLGGSSDPERNRALARWLGMASRDLSEQILVLRTTPQKSLPPTIAEASRIIREKFALTLSLAEVAKEVGLSRESLSRLFHSNLGVTFSNYLHHVRLEEARQLLAESKQSIREIARQCGYHSLSQFNRRFKSATGISPSQFRRQPSPYGTGARSGHSPLS